MIQSLNTEKLDTTVKLSRYVAQAPCKASMIETTDKDGVKRKRNPITVTDEKIVDTCLQIFQETEVARKINYNEIRAVIEKEIEEKFIKYGLVTSKNNTNSANNEILRRREIAIAKEVREYIVKNFDMSFKVDFNEFINLTGVKSAKRFGNALDMVLKIQEKNFFEWKQETISEDFSELKWELSKVSLLPSITIVLNTDKFKDISDFQKSKVRNKSQYIDHIKLGLNPEYIASVVGLGKDFTMSDRKIRNKFKISYSFRLDWLIRSIIKVQYNSNINYYTIEELQDLFGTSYEQEASFFFKVLNPAVKEINKFSELNVEIINHKNKNKIIAISFRITVEEREDMRRGVDNTAYYIASRLFYFSDEKINSIVGFAKHIETDCKDSLFSMYGKREYRDWEDEAKIAFRVEKECLDFLENDFKDFFISQQIIYDKNKMCIMKEVLLDENTNNNNNNTPYDSLATYSDTSDTNSSLNSSMGNNESTAININEDVPTVFVDSSNSLFDDNSTNNDNVTLDVTVFPNSSNDSVVKNTALKDSQFYKKSFSEKNQVIHPLKKSTEKKQAKIKLITIENSNNESIENPMQSLAHLKALLNNKQMYFSTESILEKVSILNSIPFSIFIDDEVTSSTMMRKIENENDYIKYAEIIKLYIIGKKINLFSFSDDYLKDVFYNNMISENFKEIDDDLKAKINDVSN